MYGKTMHEMGWGWGGGGDSRPKNLTFHNQIFSFLSPSQHYSQVLVYLLGLPVLAQQVPQHTHAADPQDLGGHTSIGRSLALAMAHVATLATGQGILADTSTGVHLDRLADNETILDQLADVLT